MQKARRFTNEHGIEVLAITAPIYNEPECYTAPCHVHSSDQKMLGTLDIGLSVNDLLKNLRVMRGRMAGFSIMVLLLTVGGVAALLWRNVFFPLRLLSEYAECVTKGDRIVTPPDCGPELSQLAENVSILAQRAQAPSNENVNNPTDEAKTTTPN
jgi:HAMP domain-containing protein